MSGKRFADVDNILSSRTAFFCVFLQNKRGGSSFIGRDDFQTTLNALQG